VHFNGHAVYNKRKKEYGLKLNDKEIFYFSSFQQCLCVPELIIFNSCFEYRFINNLEKNLKLLFQKGCQNIILPYLSIWQKQTIFFPQFYKYLKDGLPVGKAYKWLINSFNKKRWDYPAFFRLYGNPMNICIIVMRIKKEKVEELILKYQKKLDINILKDIIKETSDMVYNYPTIVFHVSIEKCSDFYIYFMERIPSLVLKFNPILSSFYTWFNIVLKSQCLNWLNTLKVHKKKMISVISLDQYYYDVSDNNDLYDDENVQLVRDYISNLPLLDRLIIQLLYYNIDDMLLQEISDYNHRSVDYIFTLIKKILNNNRKFIIQRKASCQIELIQSKIYDLKKQLPQVDEKTKEKLKNRIKSYSSSLNAIKKTMVHNLENMEIRSISAILNCPIRKIYYRLKVIKSNLYIKLKNKISF